MSKSVTYSVRVDGKTGKIKQSETPTGLPECINCKRPVPVAPWNTEKRKHRGRFCTNGCAIRWAHHVLNNMPAAELWKLTDEPERVGKQELES